MLLGVRKGGKEQEEENERKEEREIPAKAYAYMSDDPVIDKYIESKWANMSYWLNQFT